jgi:peptidyl-prolyl cis-trans isomerase B (cyclophilin B)
MLLLIDTMTKILAHSLIVLSMLAVLAACGQGPASEQQAGSTTPSQEPGQPGPLSAVVQCDSGRFVIRLRPDLAPMSVANFCNLVERGFYHGHEVANANTVCRSIGQTPRSPDYRVPSEYSTTLVFNKPGVVAWTFASTPEETEQLVPHPTRFFITIKPQEVWNLQYIPFGEVEEGLDVVNLMKKGDWIRSVKIVGDSTWLKESYAAEIEQWNSSLDQAGHQRAGSQPSKPAIPISSN